MLVQINQHFNGAVMTQTCQVLCFAVRLGVHEGMGTNRKNRVSFNTRARLDKHNKSISVVVEELEDVAGRTAVWMSGLCLSSQ